MPEVVNFDIIPQKRNAPLGKGSKGLRGVPCAALRLGPKHPSRASRGRVTPWGQLGGSQVCPLSWSSSQVRARDSAYC